MFRNLLITIACAVFGSAAANGAETVHRTAPRPLVWVVDGAGDLRGCSTGLAQVNGPEAGPVEPCPFFWSHGYRKLLLDQTDNAHARDQGNRLAVRIRERMRDEPGRRVVVVAHTAGSPWPWPRAKRCRPTPSTESFYWPPLFPPATTCGRHCGG